MSCPNPDTWAPTNTNNVIRSESPASNTSALGLARLSLLYNNVTSSQEETFYLGRDACIWWEASCTSTQEMCMQVRKTETWEGVNLYGICVDDVLCQLSRAAARPVRVSKHGRNEQTADARWHMGYCSELDFTGYKWFTAGIHWKGKPLRANV